MGLPVAPPRVMKEGEVGLVVIGRPNNEIEAPAGKKGLNLSVEVQGNHAVLSDVLMEIFLQNPVLIKIVEQAVIKTFLKTGTPEQIGKVMKELMNK